MTYIYLTILCFKNQILDYYLFSVDKFLNIVVVVNLLLKILPSIASASPRAETIRKSRWFKIDKVRSRSYNAIDI